ncbi:MAG TPA: enoyl-CoA hydratase/isomerase family protein, partial [Candidatus Binatia bacterium]|nr:enoyl-CoA hydratase/isomerase family protein [Candidatus Binatia bacterium]
MLDRVDHGNGLLELRLARPPVNALDAGLVQALTGELRAARSGAIVLSGRPGMYSAGLDVPYLQSLDDAGLAKFWVAFSDLLRAFAQCRVPLAAAITGHAPAGGTVLGIFCDYRVASDGDFRLGLNETQVGLPLPRGIYHAYERLLGTRRATLFALEGRLMKPAQALECGLVDEVASPAETVTRAGAWCRKLLALPAQDAVRLTLSYARADLARRLEHEVVDPEAMTRQWRSDETQR